MDTKGASGREGTSMPRSVRVLAIFLAAELLVMPATRADPACAENGSGSRHCYYHDGHYYRYRWNEQYYNYHHNHHYYRTRHKCGGNGHYHWCYN